MAPNHTLITNEELRLRIENLEDNLAKNTSITSSNAAMLVDMKDFMAGMKALNTVAAAAAKAIKFVTPLVAVAIAALAYFKKQ